MHDPAEPWEHLLGRSEAFTRVLSDARAAARCELPVLLLGPSGTGKSLLARAIHDASPRARRAFVTVPQTVPDTLFDAHLFGARRGAFTGSIQDQEGSVRLAHGGTLFVDEVGELSPLAQVKLLELVQNGRYTRLGEAAAERVDVRIIAATNAPIDRLRPDLYHRLSGFELHLPSLAERVGDVPLLASDIARTYARRRARPELRPTAGAVQVLLAHRWPGNVRELENVVRRALERAWSEGSPALEAHHLGHHHPPRSCHPRLRAQVEAFERWLVDDAMAATGNRVSEAALRLGTSPSWVYKQLALGSRRPAA